MTPKTWVRRIGVVAAALLLLAAAPGCGGGCCDYDDVLGGTLEIVNDPASFETIETIEISVPFGPIEAYDVFLFPGEAWAIDLFPDTYNVDVFWSDATVDSLVIDVFDDDFRSIVLLN